MKRYRRLSRSSAKPRVLRIQVDRLEDRQLLSTTPPLTVTTPDPTAHPTFELLPTSGGLHPDGGLSPSVSSGPYEPSQISQAYGYNQITFNGIQGDGTGQTIAIVDAYDDPDIQSDLNTFDAEFNLPAATVNKFNQNGGTSVPGTDPTGDWEVEESLDVEWAHAMAPGAKIDLFEATTNYYSDLFTAVASASKVANVVSNSYGGGEFSAETTASYDGVFSTPGVVYTVSSGDNGAPASYPAVSPNVIAVGGTSLYLDGSNNYSGESGWTGSGGGPSEYEAQPKFQAGVVTQTSTMRANPDVSYDADPDTGVYVYDSFPYYGFSLGWLEVGGTSAGAPQWAALMAIADQGRALTGQPALDNLNPQQVMTTLYANATVGDFHDITTGTSEGTPNYNAGPGYDYVTGIGSPVTYNVVQTLDGIGAPKPNVKLTIAGPTSVAAGASFDVTVDADNLDGTRDSAYTGTVQLSSSDIQAGLPASYTFQASDRGAHQFVVTLKTAGKQSITATDTSNVAITATLSGIVVNPGPVSQLVMSGLSGTQIAGTPVPFTVTSEDAYGNAVPSYTGSIHFTSSDAKAILPANSTLTKGVGKFTVTFETAGTQSLTAADTKNPGTITTTYSGIIVDPAAPTSLTASTVSATQINLSWTAAAGDTGYIIDRFNSTTDLWVQIATNATGATTYQDNTGLSPATTYYYEVQATGGGFVSAYSNVVSATTASKNITGTGPGTPVETGVDTIWSSTYTPIENAASSGAYDLGVKFETNVAGTVTGLRFYKEASMDGFYHVGYLWSTTQTLLATAAFTSETSYGWQQVNLSSPVSLTPNTVYIVSFSSGGGPFGVSTGYFNNGGVTNGPLTALANGIDGGNGVYGSGLRGFPSSSLDGDNYWADIAFEPAGSTGGGGGGGGGGGPEVTLSTGGGSPAPASYSIPIDLTNQSTGATTSNPRSPVITSALQGRQALLSGYWLARRTPSQLVTQANPPDGATS